MKSCVVVGLQWGDEGKGKVVDLLAERADFVVRGQGGSNAGHTIVRGDKEYKLHLIPSGILAPNCTCIIGAGCVLDPDILKQEIEGLKVQGVSVDGRLKISPYTHLLFPHHRLIDTLSESAKGKKAIGTTGRGIGPCYKDKVGRVGIRVGDLLDSKSRLQDVLCEKNNELSKLYGADLISEEDFFSICDRFRKIISAYVFPVEELLFRARKEGKKILFEGANGTFLDVGMGTYPFVTSSHTMAAGVVLGAGLGPTSVDGVVGIIKAYTTRVGAGPFVTELEEGEDGWDPTQSREIGTTTGRMRRLGWFDSVIARKACQLNGVTHLSITKIDILDSFKEIKVCTGYRVGDKTFKDYPPPGEWNIEPKPIYEVLEGWCTSTTNIRSYEDLPKKAKDYICFLSDLCEVPVSLISIGPDKKQTIEVEKVLL